MGPRRTRLALLALVVTATVLALAGPAVAQLPDPETPEGGQPTTTATSAPAGPVLAVGGTIKFEGEPLEGVTVTVTAADGTELEGTTGPDGVWRVDVPAAGAYTATLDDSTLPDDLAV